MKVRLTITIDENILKRFKEVCEKHGYKISTKIEKLVEEFVRKKKDKL